jgi:23S rRNA U2552 (ribose-2'-O)-methylase RlmE/FtsJ
MLVSRDAVAVESGKRERTDVSEDMLDEIRIHSSDILECKAARDVNSLGTDLLEKTSHKFVDLVVFGPLGECGEESQQCMFTFGLWKPEALIIDVSKSLEGLDSETRNIR